MIPRPSYRRALLQASLGCVLAASAMVIGLEGSAAAGMRLHECTVTRIKQVGSRLEGLPDSGSAVLFANGVPGVSYDVVPAIRRSRVGDAVRLCLVELPRGCPKGDDRGKTYAAQNLRTGGRWTLPDAEHKCGGA